MFFLPVTHFYLTAFSLDAELPDYDLDLEDETFVNKLKKKVEITLLQFEEMIDRLEKGSGQQVICHWGGAGGGLFLLVQMHEWLPC